MDNSAEILAVNVFHGDELDPIGFGKVVNPNDILVRDAPSQDKFLLEARDSVTVAGQLRTDRFERHQLSHFAVACLINRTHSALTKKSEDFIALTKDRS